jgi:hypothetical protein
VKEYQLLDRYIKKENEQLKATSQQLQDDHEETSNKLKNVLILLQYIRVIKGELKEEASAINIIIHRSKKWSLKVLKHSGFVFSCMRTCNGFGMGEC